MIADAWESRSAVLPVRFGQWFATLDELSAALAPGLERYARNLERLAGTGEFSVRILEPEPVPTGTAEAPSTGTAYLRAAAARERARAEAARRGVQVARELREALGRLVLEDRVDEPPDPPGLAVATHLVRRSEEHEYELAVERFAAAHPTLRLPRTGPWPPWSFTA
jgi:hypothetical protein